MKKLSRRRVLQRGGLLAGGVALGGVKVLAQQEAHMGMQMPAAAPGQVRPKRAKTIDAMKLASFVDALVLPQVMQPEGRQTSAMHGAVDAPYYRVPIRMVERKMHRDLPASKQWSYGDGPEPVLFEVTCGEGVLIDWVNELPAKHFLPLDSPMHDMPGLKDAPETRVVTHVHGARVPSVSDGYPEDWFGPGKNRLDYYPNRQDPTSLWVHDHALGVSRLNVFAGLMGWYVLRDEHEAGLGLPSGKCELPLLIYDRSFDPNGQLYYPNPPDEGAWAQEYLGDAMVVNGKVRPYHEVEARKYRLRIANTANSRFFSLSLSNGQSFQVIGSDQGLLAVPVEMKRLVLAPAERTDIVVDFSQARGEHVVLVSDALELMQFRVGRERVTDESVVPAVLRELPLMDESTAVKRREMTLNEFDGDNGEPMVMLLNRKHWVEPVTEIVKLGTTEIWSFVNLTQDVHPMHLHMVHFQVLDRQSFSVYDYLADNGLRTTGDVVKPAAHELGWKDVVQCPPETVTRIVVPFQGYAGKYLWHCHILEHEANDMMRPYVVEA